MSPWGAFIQRVGLVADCAPGFITGGTWLRREATVFRGPWRGMHLNLSFGGRGVVASLESPGDELEARLVAARLVPVAGLATGDVDFDARVAILGDPRILARLDARTRAVVAHLVEQGAWLEVGGVGVGPPATAQVATVEEAEALLGYLAEALGALHRDRPAEVLLAELAQAPAGCRGALVAVIDDRVRRAPSAALIHALAEHRPPEAARWLGTLAQVRLTADATLAFINAVGALGGGNHLADARLADWLHTHGEDAVRDAARAVLGATITRLVAGGNPKRLAQLLELADDRSSLYEEVCRRIQAAPTPALLEWLVAQEPRVQRSQAARLRTLAELPVDPRAFLPDLAGEPSRVERARAAVLRHLARARAAGEAPSAALLEVLRSDDALCVQVAEREGPAGDAPWLGGLWPAGEAARVQVAGLWARFGVRGGEAHLARALHEDQPAAVRRAAAAALAAVGGPASLEALREASRGFFGDSEVKRLARAALEAIGSRLGGAGGLAVAGEAERRGALSAAHPANVLDPEQ